MTLERARKNATSHEALEQALATLSAADSAHSSASADGPSTAEQQRAQELVNYYKTGGADASPRLRESLGEYKSTVVGRALENADMNTRMSVYKKNTQGTYTASRELVSPARLVSVGTDSKGQEKWFTLAPAKYGPLTSEDNDLDRGRQSFADWGRANMADAKGGRSRRVLSSRGKAVRAAANGGRSDIYGYDPMFSMQARDNIRKAEVLQSYNDALLSGRLPGQPWDKKSIRRARREAKKMRPVVHHLIDGRTVTKIKGQRVAEDYTNIKGQTIKLFRASAGDIAEAMGFGLVSAFPSGAEGTRRPARDSIRRDGQATPGPQPPRGDQPPQGGQPPQGDQKKTMTDAKGGKSRRVFRRRNNG